MADLDRLQRLAELGDDDAAQALARAQRRGGSWWCGGVVCEVDDAACAWTEPVCRSATDEAVAAYLDEAIMRATAEMAVQIWGGGAPPDPGAPVATLGPLSQDRTEYARIDRAEYRRWAARTAVCKGSS